MVPEKQISQLVQRLQSSAGEHLESVVLYGSAASSEFHADFSDVNILCVLHRSSLAAMESLAPAMAWWRKQKHPVPLLFTREELEHSADIFAIEILDIQRRHRLLLGADIFSAITVPMEFHRLQVERELRTKLLLLRQHFLAAGGDRAKILDLMLQSVSSFITLLQHSLIAMGEISNARSVSRREVLDLAEGKMQTNLSSFRRLLDLRERKQESRNLDAKAAFGEYLVAIEQVTGRVNKFLRASLQ